MEERGKKKLKEVSIYTSSFHKVYRHTHTHTHACISFFSLIGLHGKKWKKNFKNVTLQDFRNLFNTITKYLNDKTLNFG